MPLPSTGQVGSGPPLVRAAPALQAGGSFDARSPYLFRDEFPGPQAAPLDALRQCSPGPGVLVVTDTSNSYGISGGVLTPTAASSGTVALDPAFRRDLQFPRRAGLAVWGTLKRLAAAGTAQLSPGFGWMSSLPFTNNNLYGLLFPSSGNFIFNEKGGGGAVGADAFAEDTAYRIGAVLRNTGFFLIIDGKLAWVSANGADAALYPVLFARVVSSRQCSLDNFCVALQTGRWSDDYGIATQRLAGPRTDGDAFVHTADCLLEWTQTTLSSTNTDVFFRQQDASNYWRARVTSAGAFQLDEVVAGVPTNRINNAAGIASGHRCVLIAQGTTIRLFSGTAAAPAARGVYASAANFAAATGGTLSAQGTGGVASNLVTWPRDVSAYLPAEVLS